jgi:hypothetical protein
MLDRTEQDSELASSRRRVSDYLLPIALFSVAGAAMVAWIAGLCWASWRLIAWILF